MKIEPITAEMAERYREQIAQLYFENVRSNAFHNHYTYEEAFEKMNELIGHLRDNTVTVFGALEDEVLIAFIWAYVHQFREENRMYVNEIRVKEEYRKSGIGSQMLRLVEDKAEKMGLSAIYLHAEANNPEAIRFYQSAGYCEERIQLRKEIQTGSQDAGCI